MGGLALKAPRAIQHSRLPFTIIHTAQNVRLLAGHFILPPSFSCQVLTLENISSLTIVQVLSERLIPLQKRSRDLQQVPLIRSTSKLMLTGICCISPVGQALSCSLAIPTLWHLSLLHNPLLKQCL